MARTTNRTQRRRRRCRKQCEGKGTTRASLLLTLILAASSEAFQLSSCRLTRPSVSETSIPTSQYHRRSALWVATTRNREEDPNRKQDRKDETSLNRSAESSASKEQAISALSQPASKQQAISALSQPKPSNTPDKNDTKRNNSNNKKRTNGSSRRQNRSNTKKTNGSMSPLPPPPKRKKADETASSSSSSSSSSSLLPPPLPSLQTQDTTDISSGLSSWEEFLGKTTKREETAPSESLETSDKLSSIADLFPIEPDREKDKGQESKKQKDTSSTSSSSSSSSKVTEGSSSLSSSIQSLDGILPVSELFYRSTEAMSESVAKEEEEADDEESPFSAEHSGDGLSIPGNTMEEPPLKPKEQEERKSPKKKKKKSVGKMTRRGIDTFVGGLPVKIDPPQRSLHLIYRVPANKGDWANYISIGMRDFGPLSRYRTVEQMSEMEKALCCEYFVDAALKWDICPSDLREIAKNHILNRPSSSSSASSPRGSYMDLLREISKTEAEAEDSVWERGLKETPTSQTKKVNSKKDEVLEDPNSPLTFKFSIGITKEELLSDDEQEGTILREVLLKTIARAVEQKVPQMVTFREDSLSLEEDDGGTTHVSFRFQFEAAKKEDKLDVYNKIHATLTQSLDDGTFALSMAGAAREETRWTDDFRERVAEECLLSDDEDEAEQVIFALENRVSAIETETETDDSETEEEEEEEEKATSKKESELLLSTDGLDEEGLFRASEIKYAPFQRSLGPLLQDAAVQRALQRHPRVIVVGDVHGCIDELQALLRQCDYQPGDLVLFLGDLVCKGPDSVSVVQMAREIGAIGVRGNHDFEVIRWRKAIKRGVEFPVVGSEHFHIASSLTKADMKWLHSLPWYITSNDLKALFVHAGFVAGIKLAKQNPRLMMNMRSILPDGTVTSKFFGNWPWARLWDGRQTVFFGHDADRGLQQYSNALGLDTGCVYGGRLTACILPGKKLVSVNAKREYFRYRKKKY